MFKVIKDLKKKKKKDLHIFPYISYAIISFFFWHKDSLLMICENFMTSNILYENLPRRL